jgi:putative mRNA 3-end processing factor
MKLQILGGGREVGRSAVMVESAGHRLLMDYGVEIDRRPVWPLPAGRVDGVIATHSHLDHIGGFPLLYKGASPPMFCNDVTLATTMLLLEDAMKVAKREAYQLPFAEPEVRAVANAAHITSGKPAFDIGPFRTTLFPAGHIPGSVGVLLESEGKRLFYTGNFKLEDTRLLPGAELPDRVDTLVTETTYGTREHPSRHEEERKLLDVVEEALAEGEKAILPVFAVGRAQEVLLILEKYASEIALDGMAKAAAELALRYPKYLRDPKKFREVLGKVTWVRKDKEREQVLKKFPIVVTTAGMMSGGPIIYYLRKLRGQRAKVIFCGFLAEDSPGRLLLETGVLKTAETEFRVKCDVRQLNLSAHASRQEIFELIKRTRPLEVFGVHGPDVEIFARDVEKKFGIKAHAPANGEVFEI